MKSPEEIKKGLEACSADECHGQHAGCPYQDQLFCTMRMCGDALAYINQLEETIARQKERYRRLLETASILSVAVDELERCAIGGNN